MDIIAGASRIPVLGVTEERRFYNDLTRPALRVAVNGGITAQQIEDMKTNPWKLISTKTGTDEELSTQTGFSVLESHDLLFIKTDEIEQENIRLKAELQTLAAEVALLKNAEMPLEPVIK